MAAKEMTAKEMGRKGGKARAANLSKEEIAAIGRKGAEKRWGKKPGLKGAK
jgi:general stress protein YciG